MYPDGRILPRFCGALGVSDLLGDRGHDHDLCSFSFSSSFWSCLQPLCQQAYNSLGVPPPLSGAELPAQAGVLQDQL